MFPQLPVFPAVQIFLAVPCELELDAFRFSLEPFSHDPLPNTPCSSPNAALSWHAHAERRYNCRLPGARVRGPAGAEMSVRVCGNAPEGADPGTIVSAWLRGSAGDTCTRSTSRGSEVSLQQGAARVNWGLMQSGPKPVCGVQRPSRQVLAAAMGLHNLVGLPIVARTSLLVRGLADTMSSNTALLGKTCR